jgi:hypothetical protein
MTSTRQRTALTLAIVLLIPIAFVAYVWHYWNSKNVPSEIANFHPISFEAKADQRFFYSIGQDLRNSDEVDPHAPTLLRGEITNFLVSPDNSMIAVVANGFLTIVGQEKLIRRAVPVDSIYTEPKPIGRSLFRDNEFQWSRDSKSLYLIKDEYYKSKGSQLFSDKGELWRFDIETGKLEIVLKPFPSENYFFGLHSGIYFSVPTETGDLQLRYFDGKRTVDIDTPQSTAIPPDALSPDFIESPFRSFDITEYKQKVLGKKGIKIEIDRASHRLKLRVKDKAPIELTEGHNFKGDYYCDKMLRSVFLPGDRYFLFNASYCGNFNGQLLIDSVNGSYEELPAGTRVYVTLNTETFPHFNVSCGGLDA